METQRRESNLPRRVRENFSWTVSLEINKGSSLQLAGLPFIHSSLMCWVPLIVLDAVHTTLNKTKSLPAWRLHSDGGSGWHYREKLRMVPSDHPVSTLWPHFLSHVYFPESRVPRALKWEQFDLFVSTALIVKQNCQFIAYHHNGIISELQDQIKSGSWKCRAKHQFQAEIKLRRGTPRLCHENSLPSFTSGGLFCQ